MNGKSDYVEKLFADVSRSQNKMKKHIGEMCSVLERTSSSTTALSLCHLNVSLYHAVPCPQI